MNARHFMTAFATLSFIFAISVGTAVADDEANSDKPSVEKKVEIKVQVRADGNENVEVDGNKIRITLPDGTTKTIDLSELAKGNIKGLEQFHKLGGDKVKIHGKATIVGPDGKVREIEIDEKNVGHFRATLPKNAQGEKKIEIRVEAQGDKHGQTKADERKIRVTLLDQEPPKKPGDAEVQIRRKAVFVGPDGKAHAIELDGKNGGNWHGVLPKDAKIILRGIQKLPEDGFQLELPHGVEALMPSSKFMIGVVIALPSETLRSQLGLDEDTGIVVTSVLPKSSAASAGIKAHDVLISANDIAMGTVEGLVHAVEEAGKESDELNIKLIRNGKTQKISVKPAERKDMPQADLIPGNGGVFEFKVSPGNTGSSDPKHLHNFLLKQLHEHSELPHQLHEHGELPHNHDSPFQTPNGNLEEVMKHIKSLEARIKQLEQK